MHNACSNTAPHLPQLRAKQRTTYRFQKNADENPGATATAKIFAPVSQQSKHNRGAGSKLASVAATERMERKKLAPAPVAVVPPSARAKKAGGGGGGCCGSRPSN